MPGFDVPGNRHADGLRIHLLAHHYFASPDDIAVQQFDRMHRQHTSLANVQVQSKCFSAVIARTRIPEAAADRS